MLRTMLKGKIHRATVTEADLHYEGSVTIDRSLMDAAGIVEYEQVHIYDVDNGNRFSTYAIPGEPGSGVLCLNGAAARKVSKGDIVIIACYASCDEEEMAGFRPRLVYVDERNRIK
jgi:aspartate 1-decarboxylase